MDAQKKKEAEKKAEEGGRRVILRGLGLRRGASLHAGMMGEGSAAAAWGNVFRLGADVLSGKFLKSMERR